MSMPRPTRRLPHARNALALAVVLLISQHVYAGTTVVSYTYDAGDHVTSVTDPRGLVTRYAYDGIGQLWQQTSPDTGTTGYGYDGNGRRANMTRANGVQTSYGYDAIGRLISLGASGQSQTFTYDTCANGIGRLCAAADTTGSVGYSYTPEGWISGRAFTVGSTSYSVGYGYNAMGQVSAVVYPDGNQALYSYTSGVVSSVSLNVGGSAITAASQITYLPQDKAMAGWTSSNGLSTALSYDTDGRLTGINVPNVQSLGLSYDNADRIIQLTNGVNPGLTQSFGYDDQSRLISVYGDQDNESYQYDANGNRIAQTVNGVSQNITYDTASNRMLKAGSTSYGYDAQGNTTSVNGISQWQYNAFNRLATNVGNTYYVDPQGQRLMKTAGSTVTYFAPEENNNLVAENDSGTWVDYVWLNGRLIGRVTAGQVQALHVDQVGRPETVTDANQVVVWRAQNLAFTRNVMIANGVTLNIGFPGQYYDAELGVWNNGFRDYLGTVGRYIESDPIGMGAGTNTYAYVGGNPLSRVDPFGEAAHVYVSGSTVQIFIPVFYDSTVSADTQKIWTHDIEVDWSGNYGGYNVTTTVVLGDPSDVDTNIISAASAGAHSEVIGGRKGKWACDADSGTIAHEAGHLMGLPDVYVDVPAPGANWGVTSHAFPGFENDRMGGNRYAAPSAQDILGIITSAR